ncbi:protein containing Endonuclease/exonuclease/phosphatase domain [Pseudovibrio sp. FO-BEG1]|nr:protein containing Endonuclease/exonuclease/phosphatase domain [Pseudovibrio sp. FO-BEG1]
MKKAVLAISVSLLMASTTMGFASETSLSIMSYNVENLFDTADDPKNPHDDTYLPKAEKDARGAAHVKSCEDNNNREWYVKDCLNMDWSKSTYETKLSALASVITSFDELPAVLVLPETENKQVVTDLMGKLPAGSFPEVVQLNSSAEKGNRGIDVAMVSKLPLKSDPKAIKVFPENGGEGACRVTRDIVQAEFELPTGESLHVFGVHFPSGGRGLDCRLQAFDVLNDAFKALPPNSLAIAAGDFNFNCGDWTRSDKVVQKKAAEIGWAYSDKVNSCKAPGSSFYWKNKTWSFLDVIMASPAMTEASASWKADIGSFTEVISHDSQMRTDAETGLVVPNRFNIKTGKGVSDHLPVAMTISSEK